MKTLVRTSDNLSLYIFQDDEHLQISSDNIIVGSPEKLIIADCNSTNVTLHVDISPPANWAGGKYLFDGTDWTENPNWAGLEPVRDPLLDGVSVN